MSDRRLGDVRRYLAREVAAGRARVLLPHPTPAPGAAASPSPSPASPTPSSSAPATSAGAQRAPASRAPDRESTGPGPDTVSASGALAPFTNLRDDATVAAIGDALAPVDARAQACVACALHETRNTVVFGTGSGRSGIVFVGEAPGANEDEQGVPFVGRAGQLLDRILAAIGVRREDVYICNVLKCRPPGNRDPKPEEAALCAPFLREQLDALEPRIICALGLHAARWLLQTNTAMARLRGKVMTYHGIPTIATYHPAALLRNPNLKRNAWEDFQLLRKLAEEDRIAPDEDQQLTL